MSINDDLLISKLIEETCSDKLETEHEDNVIDLQKYFEKRLNEVEFLSVGDYLKQNNLEYSDIQYQISTKCYRLIHNHEILDFPSNWSVFKDLSLQNLVYVDQSIDQDFLLDILSEIKISCESFVLINENQRIWLILFSRDEQELHLKWLQNYFKNKNKSEQEKAA